MATIKQTGSAFPNASEIFEQLGSETVAQITDDPLDAWSFQGAGATVIMSLQTMNRRVFTVAIDARSAHDLSTRLLEAAAQAQLRAQGGR